MQDRLVVAHLRTSYLPGTVTFVHQYITNMKRYHPIMLAAFRVNPKQFPFPDLYIPSLSKIEQILLRAEQYIFHKQRLVLPYYRNMIETNNARVLHAHGGNMGVYALDVSRKTRLPMVTTFYGADMSRLPQQRPRWRRSYQKLFQEGRLFLVEGPHMRRGLIKLGCPPEKVDIQRIGVDLQQFAYRPPPPITESIRILMVGRFTEKKGLEYGIRAFANVLSDHPNIQLHILGDGPLQPSIQQLIRELNLANDEHITLHGQVDYATYINETAKAHLFMAPSITASDGDSEGGAPTVLLEMQARGIPILSTYHADIPDVVIDGQSGLLAPERDEIALAKNMRTLLNDPNGWVAMGRAGRSHVENHHDIRKLAKQLEARYDLL